MPLTTFRVSRTFMIAKPDRLATQLHKLCGICKAFVDHRACLTGKIDQNPLDQHVFMHRWILTVRAEDELCAGFFGFLQEVVLRCWATVSCDATS